MVKKNKQKWLTDQISGDWKDKDTIIETALEQCLFHYVEKELNGIIPDHSFYEEDLKAGHISERYVKRQIALYDAIRQAYTYFKNERDLLEREIEDAFSANDISRASEAEITLYDRDTEMLSTIVKYRGYMWT